MSRFGGFQFSLPLSFLRFIVLPRETLFLPFLTLGHVPVFCRYDLNGLLRLIYRSKVDHKSWFPPLGVAFCSDLLPFCVVVLNSNSNHISKLKCSPTVRSQLSNMFKKLNTDKNRVFLIFLYFFTLLLRRNSYIVQWLQQRD